MNYDIESNIISWEISKGKIDHVVELGSFLVHVSKAKKPIMVEILDASNFIGKIDKIKNISTIKQIEKIVPAN